MNKLVVLLTTKSMSGWLASSCCCKKDPVIWKIMSELLLQNPGGYKMVLIGNFLGLNTSKSESEFSLCHSLERDKSGANEGSE